MDDSGRSSHQTQNQPRQPYNYGVPLDWNSAVYSSLSSSASSAAVPRQQYPNYNENQNRNPNYNYEREVEAREQEYYYPRQATIQQSQLEDIARAQALDAEVQKSQLRSYQLDQHQLAIQQQQQRYEQEYQYRGEEGRGGESYRQEYDNYRVSESRFRNEQEYYQQQQLDQEQSQYTPSYETNQSDYFEPNSNSHYEYEQYEPRSQQQQYPQQPVFVPDNSPPPLSYVQLNYNPHPTEYQQIALLERRHREESERQQQGDYDYRRAISQPAEESHHRTQRTETRNSVPESNQPTVVLPQRTNSLPSTDSAPARKPSSTVTKKVTTAKRVVVKAPKAVKTKAPAGLVRPRSVVPTPKPRSRSSSPVPYFAVERKRQLRPRIPSAPLPPTVPIVPLRTDKIPKRPPPVRRVIPAPIPSPEPDPEPIKKVEVVRLPSPVVEPKKAEVPPVIAPVPKPIAKPLKSTESTESIPIETVEASPRVTRPRPSYAPVSESEESYVDEEEVVESSSEEDRDFSEKIEAVEKDDVRTKSKSNAVKKPSARVPRMLTSRESPEGTLFSSKIKPFIAKLTYLLQNPKTYGTILRWDSTGNQIVVNITEPRLISEVLPKFYSHKSPAAFQRQLNVYGFVRITHEALEEVVKATDELTLEYRHYIGYQHDTYDRSTTNIALAAFLPAPSKARAAKAVERTSSGSNRTFKPKVAIKSPKKSPKKTRSRTSLQLREGSDVAEEMMQPILEENISNSRQNSMEVSIGGSSPLTEVEDLDVKYEEDERMNSVEYSYESDPEDSLRDDLMDRMDEDYESHLDSRRRRGSV